MEKQLIMLRELNPGVTFYPHPGGIPNCYLYEGSIGMDERRIIYDVFSIRLLSVVSTSALVGLVDACMNPLLKN